MLIRLSNKLQSDSIVDGVGMRTVIWTQGCSHNCLGCHNPQTHSFNSGVLYEVDEIKKQIDLLKKQDGITFSGGDPFYQVEPCLEIARYCREKGYNIWCYTGFIYEDLLKMGNKVLQFLKNIDVLVDGKFDISQKSYNLKYKGSYNQRIIDVQRSLKENKVILLEEQKKEVKKEKIYI